MPLLETEANQMKQGERSRGFTPEIERCLTMKRNKELNCPNDSEMFAYFEGTLSALHRRSVEKHLAGCDSCRESLAWLIQSAAEVAEGEPDEPSVEEVRTQVARLVAFAGQDAGAAAPPIHGQSRRKGYRASDHQGTTLFGLQISPRLILAAAALILMAAALPIIYLTLSGQSLDKQSTQGRLALEEAVKSGRRVETRISGLDY
ncbi:MAG TPA: zf-HC2 domain-containing protein, partial [Blastocatellia bacterium]|nr:zf-HC2 domain-containing protein [Blastocatellia bacterium]